MARRYKSKKRHSAAKPSVLSMIPIGYLGIRAYEGYKAGGAQTSMAYVVDNMTGYDMRQKKFTGTEAVNFYGLVLGTVVAKKVIGMAGVNRSLKGFPIRL